MDLDLMISFLSFIPASLYQSLLVSVVDIIGIIIHLATETGNCGLYW